MGSRTLFDQAIKLYLSLIVREGRRELRGDLARAMVLRARILVDSAEYQQAKVELRKARSILEAEIARASRADLHSALNLGEMLLEAVEGATRPNGTPGYDK
jgi:hypothetical protein